MKPHYSEADLLETYYMRPCDSTPVMVHLSGCAECTARYEQLDRKLRELATPPAEKPETFWSRQRLSIARRIAVLPHRTRIASVARIAAAALLSFISGAAIMYHELNPSAPATTSANSAVVAKAPTADNMHAPINPWESDELKSYHEVVQWESWMTEQDKEGGSL